VETHTYAYVSFVIFYIDDNNCDIRLFLIVATF